jgi:hypothetical protein
MQAMHVRLKQCTGQKVSHAISKKLADGSLVFCSASFLLCLLPLPLLLLTLPLQTTLFPSPKVRWWLQMLLFMLGPRHWSGLGKDSQFAFGSRVGQQIKRLATAKRRQLFAIKANAAAMSQTQQQ